MQNEDSKNGEAGIIHTAPKAGVKISPDLEAYLNRVEDEIELMVARPLK
ncbi:hypothetical protein H6F51_07580 [Cyanobacteria bacterium FACHB-DQ100]|nr:hypothetical protein [Cyanobacteria bacterium FACHB-DQ100]